MATDQSRVIARLQRLQRLTSALSRAVLVDDVVDVVVTTVVQELGAQGGLLAFVDDDATNLRVVGSVGFSPANVQQWSTIPIDAPLPAGDAMRSGALVAWESTEDRDRRYPTLLGTSTTHEAYAIVPLIAPDGPALGIIALGFEDPRTLDEIDRSFVQAVTDQCTQAIIRARLYDEQRVQAVHNGFLAEASKRLATASGFATTMQEVVAMAAEELADGAVVLLAVPGGLRPFTAAHRMPSLDAVWRQGVAERGFAQSPVPEQVLESGVPLYLDDVAASLPPEARTPEVEQFLSTAVIPLQARQRAIGVLVLLDTEARRRRTRTDRTLAESFCALVALNVDNARLLEEQTRIARRLQANLLPPTLPQIEGLDIGATYHAAGAGNEVGGDFYDVFQVTPDRWFVVAGDVRGRGVDAAATTGLARHTIRAAAVAGARGAPTAVARRLNEVLLNDEPDADEPRFCGVCIVAVALDDRGATLAVCCAGSPLPRLVHGDGTVVEVGAPGTVAGVEREPDLQQVELRLEGDQALVIFTDGIPDGHVAGRFFEDRIPAVLAERAGASAQELVDHLRAEAIAFVGGEPDDDMAAVALRVVRG